MEVMVRMGWGKGWGCCLRKNRRNVLCVPRSLGPAFLSKQTKRTVCGFKTDENISYIRTGLYCISFDESARPTLCVLLPVMARR